MPFQSLAQARKCYAMARRGLAKGWDCKEWSSHTNWKSLPKKVDDGPSKEEPVVEKKADGVDPGKLLASLALLGAVPATGAALGGLHGLMHGRPGEGALRGALYGTTIPLGMMGGGLGGGLLGTGLGAAAGLSMFDPKAPQFYKQPDKLEAALMLASGTGLGAGGVFGAGLGGLGGYGATRAFLGPASWEKNQPTENEKRRDEEEKQAQQLNLIKLATEIANFSVDPQALPGLNPILLTYLDQKLQTKQAFVPSPALVPPPAPPAADPSMMAGMGGMGGAPLPAAPAGMPPMAAPTDPSQAGGSPLLPDPAAQAAPAAAGMPASPAPAPSPDGSLAGTVPAGGGTSDPNAIRAIIREEMQNAKGGGGGKGGGKVDLQNQIQTIGTEVDRVRKLLTSMFSLNEWPMPPDILDASVPAAGQQQQPGQQAAPGQEPVATGKA